MPKVVVPVADDPLVTSRNKAPQNVDTVHPEVAAMLPRWIRIRDVIEGEHAIKAKGTEYLPMPNAKDTSLENQERYASYVERAQFYQSTQRTLLGLVGQVFALDPVIELPPALEPLRLNADGNGVTLASSLEQTVAAVVAFGRAGLFVDYPKTEGPVTVQERDSGLVRPNIIYCDAFTIVNYRTRKIGAVMKLSLVVLAEVHEDQSDGFESKFVQQWRVLKLDSSDEYVYELYRRKQSSEDNEDANASEIELVEGPVKPVKSDGTYFKDIPFFFVGSLNNNQHPDNPPLEGISNLNIGHYRNSADYEEASFMVGQPTVWMSGLDDRWIKEVFKEETVFIGSRAIIPLPANASMGIVQAQPNSLPLEAMKLKEKQMTALGAKLVEPAQVQRTLGEARLEEATSSSILVTCVKNVQTAYIAALEVAKLFHGDTGEIKLSISTDFAISRLDPNERVALLNEWISGGITTNEYRTQLRKAGIAEDPDSSPEIKRPETPPPSQPKE